MYCTCRNSSECGLLSQVYYYPNKDGIVSGADYLAWADNFGQQVTRESLFSDFNGDGRIDGADYTTWADHLGRAVPGSHPPNDHPVLFPIETREAREGVEVQFVPQVIDVINAGLVFSLLGAPDAATIDPTTGLFSWTPQEDDGGKTFELQLLVSEVGRPEYSASQTVVILVDEVNQRPVIELVGDQRIELGDMLSFTVHARDEDLPVQSLIFGLGPNAIPGLAINSGTGVVEWDTSIANPPLGEYKVTVTVTDNGIEPLTDSGQVRISLVDTTLPRIVGSQPTPSADLPTGPQSIVVYFSELMAVHGAALSISDLVLEGEGVGSAHVVAADWLSDSSARFLLSGVWGTGNVAARLANQRFFDLANNGLSALDVTSFSIRSRSETLVRYSLVLKGLDGVEFPRDGDGRYLIPPEVTIQVDVFVEDLRPAPDHGGVFAAFVDLQYGQWIVFDPLTLEHGPTLARVASGEVLSDLGLVDQLGGVGNGTRPTENVQLLATLQAQVGNDIGVFPLHLAVEDALGYGTLLYGLSHPSLAEYVDAIVSVSSYPWSNPTNPLDVNNDGRVTDDDAQLVLDYLDLLGIGILSAPNRDFHPAPFLDVNRDGQLTPADALLIFNQKFGQTAVADTAPMHSELSSNRISRPHGFRSVAEDIAVSRLAIDEVFELLHHKSSLLAPAFRSGQAVQVLKGAKFKR